MPRGHTFRAADPRTVVSKDTFGTCPVRDLVIHRYILYSAVIEAVFFCKKVGFYL